MDYFTGAAMIIFMCIIILCVVSLRKKAEFLLNFLLRGVIGIISIFFINEMMAQQNFSMMVGINPWTALTSATLGLPGVALLYSIHLFKFL